MYNYIGLGLNFEIRGNEIRWTETKYVELEQFLHAFTSRGFHSVSWAFLLPFIAGFYRFFHCTGKTTFCHGKNTTLSPCAISYRCSIVTESLSPTIFEIMGILYIWVTTLTFLGHLTSSVTWPFDSPGAISYTCSIVTESLSLTVFEIFGPKTRAHTPNHTHTHRHKWFYILSHPMYCIGQTMNSFNIML